MMVICTSFEPDSFHNNSPFSLNDKFTQKEALTINLLAKTGNDSVKKILVLVLLKVYRSHLYCCNQAYAIGNKSEVDSLVNPVLFNFYKISDFSISNELVLSSDIYNWVMTKNEHITWQPIKEEIDKIQVRLNKIKAGDF